MSVILVIDIWNTAAKTYFDSIRDLFPLFKGGIDSSWVVGASMEQKY